LAAKRSKKSFYSSDLAFLHNQHYSDFVTHAAPGAISILRSAGIQRGVVLDLGCGGGQLSARLHAAGYRPVGIDVSAAMIRLARKRVSQSKFICASISTAELQPCDSAVALGEVFNYLSSAGEIVRAFKKVFRSLRPGGVLVFDIKEPLPGRGEKTRSVARWGNDWAVLAEVVEDPRRSRLTRKIVAFRKSGKGYRRSYEVHQQIIFPAKRIKQLLGDAGFRVRVMRGYGTYLLSRDHRVMVATKPLPKRGSR
jgi:SAM-dependent methyltransferase